MSSNPATNNPAEYSDDDDDDDDFIVDKDQEDPNDQRYQASDWLQNIFTLPRSSVLHTIRGPVLAVMVWSGLLSALYSGMQIGRIQQADVLVRFLLPSTTPHAATVSALGLLLVFRTNSAYQKFNEGRLIWEHILSISRNFTRMIYMYHPDISVPRRRRIFRLLAAFPYLLRRHIAERDQQKDGALVPQPIDRYSLPWSLLPNAELQLCLDSSNKPLWICDRIGQEIQLVTYTDNYTNREREKLLKYVNALTEAVSECERIHNTAVPLNYARHSLRGLTLWLFTLPLALLESFGWWTAPVMGLAAWLLYGIYQIGYVIEDPFQGSLRLTTLCDSIYRDIIFGRRRASAFTVEVGQDDQEWRDLPIPTP
jgi:predicted membrane chloride channel (bestrophin family)